MVARVADGLVGRKLIRQSRSDVSVCDGSQSGSTGRQDPSLGLLAPECSLANGFGPAA